MIVGGDEWGSWGGQGEAVVVIAGIASLPISSVAPGSFGKIKIFISNGPGVPPNLNRLPGGEVNASGDH
jgi:hypothetical protein